MDKQTIRDIDVDGKRVLVRVDFNVPINEDTGTIMDDSRIKASLPTIQYLIEHNAKVILCSHLGRPKGKRDNRYSLKSVASQVSQKLGKPVGFSEDCIGEQTEKEANALKNGDVLLLENVRFYPEEEKGDKEFARALSKIADIYVDDAFGTAHRNHASIVGIASYLPAVAGFLLEKEITTLGGLLKNPVHPFGTLLGGAKVSDKVALMQNILSKVDILLVGGGMAATFLKAQGYEIGQSLFEEDKLETALSLIEYVSGNKVNLVLPVDAVVTNDISDKGVYQVVPIDKVPSDKIIVDIGPGTQKKFELELAKCQTVFWNGPMGVYEITQFARGTEAIAKLLADLKASTIIGGGSTAEIVTNLGLADNMTFVSTGGGASMSFLSGEKLPGVEALMNK